MGDSTARCDTRTVRPAVTLADCKLNIKVFGNQLSGPEDCPDSRESPVPFRWGEILVASPLIQGRNGITLKGMAWAVFPKKMKSDRKEDRATSQLALRIRKGVKKEGRRGKRKEKEGREGKILLISVTPILFNSKKGEK